MSKPHVNLGLSPWRGEGVGGGGGGGGGGVFYPQLSQPNTRDFYHLNSLFPIFRPWVSTLDVVPFLSPSHTFTKNGEFNITIHPHPTRRNATCI